MKMTRQPEHRGNKCIFNGCDDHLSYYVPTFTDLSSYLDGNLLEKPFLCIMERQDCPIPFPQGNGPRM